MGIVVLTMRILAIAVLLVALSVGATGTHPTAYSAHLVPAMSAPSCNRLPTVAITPTSPKNISDLSIPVGANLNFNVSIANSCPIGAFTVFILYNSTVLHPSSTPLDYSATVLGSQAQVSHECIADQAVQGQCDKDSDGPDRVSLELFLLGNQSTPDPTSGLLFKLSFTVVAKGTSQLHLFNVLTNNGAASVSGGGKSFLVYPDTTNGDAFFANALCSTKICQAPIVTVSPQQTALYTRRQGTFNSNGTSSRNPAGHIRSKYWDFGDLSASTDNSTVVAHAYQTPNNYTLTLSATDSYGVTASRSIQVSVGEIWVEVSIEDVRVTPFIGVYAGTVIHIVASIFNNSVFPVNTTLTIFTEGRVLNNFTFHNLPSKSSGPPLTATWDTTGLATRIYRIDSIATPPPNANSTAHSIRFSYVQIIDPLPAGIRLSLAQTAGLSILVVGLVVFVATRFRRRPAWETEPL